jgi:hypothetical protein
MGLFDFFKKEEKTEKKSKPITDMTEWIKHPMEFNKTPESVEIADSKILFTPNQKSEECYLMRFRVDGKEFIGFTGPITWCFFDIDFAGHSFEDLYLKYIGWYVYFLANHSGKYKELEKESDREPFKKLLEDDGYTKITITQAANIAGGNYYVATATQDWGDEELDEEETDEEIFCLVGTDDSCLEL